jgi:hypothetical protein
MHCASCDWSNWDGVGPVCVRICLACHGGVARQTAEKWRDFGAQGIICLYACVHDLLLNVFMFTYVLPERKEGVFPPNCAEVAGD